MRTRTTVLAVVLTLSACIESGHAKDPTPDPNPKIGLTQLEIEGHSCQLSFNHKNARQGIGIDRTTKKLLFPGDDVYPNVFIALYEEGADGIASELALKMKGESAKVFKTPYVTLTFEKPVKIEADHSTALEEAIDVILYQDDQVMNWELIAAEWSSMLWKKAKRRWGQKKKR